MPAPKITTPEVRVTLDDGSEHVVQTITADLIRWDLTRHKHGWPVVDRAGTGAVLWLAFIAWAALRRTGAVDATWETFADTVVSVETTRAAEVDPTQPGATPA